MLRLGGSDPRDGRNSENDLYSGIHISERVDELQKVGGDFIDREVVKLVPLLVELTASNSGTEREYGTVLSRTPAFGETKGKHEYVDFFETAPNRGKMAPPVRLVFLPRRKSARLNAGTVGVDEATVLFPNVFARLKAAVGPLKKLYQLAGCVDVAVSGSENSIAERMG